MYFWNSCHLLVFAIFNEFASSKLRDENKSRKTRNGTASEMKGITIKDTGLVALHKGDVALVFYLTVTNKGVVPIHISVTTKKCCQTLTANDTDCESIVPIGGYMGELFPGDTRNLTLLYPNLYLHDRVGTCEFEVSSRAGGVMTKEMKFNTTLPRGSVKHLPPVIEQYFKQNEMKDCKSIDEDPLNECEPVTCLVKYNGFRNFFNHSTRQCEPVAICKATNEDKPDIAYVSISNSCRKLDSQLSEADLNSFKSGQVKHATLKQLHGFPMNIRCHKGKLDKAHGWCTCNPGWTSVPFDHTSFNPDTMVYHMCSVWTGSKKEAAKQNIARIKYKKQNYSKAIIAAICTVIAVIVIIVVAVICIKKHPKDNKQSSPEQVEQEMELLRMTGESDPEVEIAETRDL